MFFTSLPIGTKDAILAISVLTILVLTVIYKWSPVEFIVTEIAVCLAYFGGTMNQVKRLK